MAVSETRRPGPSEQVRPLLGGGGDAEGDGDLGRARGFALDLRYARDKFDRETYLAIRRDLEADGD